MKAQNNLNILMIIIISAIMIILSGCGSSSPASSAGGGGAGGGGAVVPAAPVLLSATPASGQVTLSWIPVTGATSYKIYESLATGTLATKTLLGSVTAASVSVINLTNGTAYYFQVTAVNANGESAGSNEVSATPNPPGTNWSVLPTGGTLVSLRSINFLNNQWIAGGVLGYIYSTANVLNGLTTINLPVNDTITTITFANGTYVVGTNMGKIFTSPTGAAGTWVQRAGRFTFNGCNSVAFGNGKFVIGGGGSSLDEVVQVSADNGATWQIASMSAYASTVTLVTTYPVFNKIIFANGQFVAAGYDAALPGPTIFSSTDGIAWTRHNAGIPTGLPGFSSIVFAGGQYVAVAGGTVVTSADGLTWTSRGVVSAQTLEDITYGNGIYVAVGWAGTILTSTDGITWNTLPVLPNTGNLYGVAFFNNQFVAVGNDTSLLTRGAILTSP